MKIVQKIIFLFCLFLLTGLSYGNMRTITAVTNDGDWKTNTTWDRGAIPQDGDIVVVPAGITVQVTTNLYSPASRFPLMQVKIYGKVNLTVGQLNLACGSSICVFDNGVLMADGCNGSQLAIGGSKPDWQGMFDVSISNGSCLTGDGCILPVTLIDFKGVDKDAKTNLTWSSAQEINFSLYEIEKSSDGMKFQTIGSVNGNKNSGTINYYSFTDKTSNTGITYYRLKMSDLDSSFSYSKIISVLNTGESDLSLSVYPNPAQSSDQINVLINTASLEEVSVVLTDIFGKEYISQPLSLENGSGFFKLNELQVLNAGVYMLVVAGENKTSTKKIIVK